MKYILVLLALGIAFSSCTTAPPKETSSQMAYTYTKLKILDLDQMSDLIQERLKSYKKTGNEEFLNEALTICLSRPNEDGLVGKLIESIRYIAEANDIWEQSVETVVQGSVAQLKMESAAGEDQVTYLVVLTNLIAEFKPEFVKQYKSPMFETRIIERIAEANLIVPETAVNDMRMNVMDVPLSPSAVAQSMVEERNRQLQPKP